VKQPTGAAFSVPGVSPAAHATRATAAAAAAAEEERKPLLC
tara:strand:- start:187 stop:309 length:123 start_codon:yes stop_codon:yes gene_type:complete